MMRVRSFVGRLRRNAEARVVVAFSLGTLVFAAGGNRLLTEWADPAELGMYYMYMNVAQWLAIPAVGAFHLVFRYWVTAKRARASASFFRFLGVGIAAEALVAALATVFLSRTDHRLSGIAVVAVWLTGVAQAAAQAVAAVPASERKRVVVGLMAFATTPVRYFVLAAGIGLWGLRAGTEMIWVQAVYAVMLAAGAWWIFAAAVDWDHRAELRRVLPRGVGREVVRFSGPYVATGALMQLCTSAERWGLARLDSPAATALFVLSVGLCTAAARALGSPLLMYFQPLVTQAASEADVEGVRRHLRRLTVATAALMAFAAVVASFLAPIAAMLLFGKQFGAIANVLPWTAIGACAFALGQALAMYPYAGRDALAPNLAHGGTLLVYAALLFAYRPAEAPVLAFARIYAVTNVAYAASMAIVAATWSRKFARFGAKSWGDVVTKAAI